VPFVDGLIHSLYSIYAHDNKPSNATKPIEITIYVVNDKIQDHTISLEHI
jgi:lipopolysaccharide biosynthesis glycosyltransferase